MRRLLLIVLMLTGLVWADRMVFSPGKVVTEPGQKAVIAFDGQTELLLLTTDLVASKPTKVLEALPLPARPTISLGDPKLLQNLAQLIARKQGPQEAMRGGGHGHIELLEHKKLGPHDLVVLELRDTVALNRLLSKELNETLSPQAVGLVNDYLKRGCRYLVVDLVELGTELGSVPPVAYRFRSSEAFYPLMTSNLVGGQGAVDLFLLVPAETRRSLEEGAQLPFPSYGEVQDPVLAPPAEAPELPRDSSYVTTGVLPLTGDEVKRLDPGLARLLPAGGLLYGHHYVGPLKFSRDLRLSNSWLGLAPAQRALERHDLEALRAALAAEPAAVNATDCGKRSLLHRAARNGAPEAARLLLQAGASVKARDVSRNTPLLAAVEGRSAPVVQLLLAAGASVADRDEYGSSALHRSVEQPELVKLLLAAGADVNAADTGGETVVMRAAEAGSAEALRLVLTPAAQVNAADRRGYTALHLAAKSGSAEKVRLLLARGASTTARNEQNQTPRDVARGEAAAALEGR